VKKRNLLYLSISIAVLLITCTIGLSASRWFTIYQSGEVTTCVDSLTTKRYGDNKEYIETWLKYSLQDGEIIAHYYVRISDLSFIEAEFAVYDKSGNCVEEYNRRNKGWQHPTPESNMENALSALVKWVNINLKNR
jgi:hypothetical protein